MAMPILAKDISEIKTTTAHYILGISRIMRLVNMYFGTIFWSLITNLGPKIHFYVPNLYTNQNFVCQKMHYLMVQLLSEHTAKYFIDTLAIALSLIIFIPKSL